MGDAVNIAQRLMQVAGQLKTDIVLGDNTAQSLQLMMPQLQALGAVNLLGKDQPVSVFVIPITKVIEETP
jgi:class 3 adenylate cyclase